jgi:hypothetical protein
MPNIELVCPTCNQKHLLNVTESQAKAEAPIYLLCPNLDRRYRLMGFYIDYSRSFYSTPAFKEQADSYTEDLKATLDGLVKSQMHDKYLKTKHLLLDLSL